MHGRGWAYFSFLAITAMLVGYKVRGVSADDSSTSLSDVREIWRCLLKSEVCSKLVLWEWHTINNDECISPCVMIFCRNTPLSLSLLKILYLKEVPTKLKAILYILWWCLSISVYGKNLKTFFSFNLYGYHPKDCSLMKSQNSAMIPLWWKLVKRYLALNKWRLLYCRQSHQNILIHKICCRLREEWLISPQCWLRFSGSKRIKKSRPEYGSESSPTLL